MLPLVGFEADTNLRKLSLILSNSINLAFSSEQRPLRISIHPDDYELLLAKDIKRFLKRVTVNRCYKELF